MNIAIRPGVIRSLSTHNLSRIESHVGIDPGEVMKSIAFATADAFGFPWQSLFGKARRQPACFYRQVAMTMCCEFTAVSQEQIARFFGKDDHGCVVHARRRVHDTESISPKVHNIVRELRISLAQRLSPTYIAARPAVNQYAKEENTQENESRVRRNES